MEKLYYGGLLLFLLLFAFKALLTVIYWRKTSLQAEDSSKSSDGFSVIQPILSGDPMLERNLAENLKNLQRVKFIWLVDKNDHEAQSIIQRIFTEYSQDRSRVTVLEIDEIPVNLNPKMYKLVQAMPYLERYTVILDDDTVIGEQGLQQAVGQLAEESLVTGIPIYINQATGLFSKLVTAFVNANSLFTYLPMALLAQPKTINGMYYVTSAAIVRRLDAFQQIADKLCDDYEIAKLFRAHKIPIVQSTAICRIRTTVEGVAHYQKLMKRWMVFANQFLKENISVAILVIVILPSFMPLALLLLSITLGWNFIVIFLMTHFLKAAGYSYIRKKWAGNNEDIMAPCYEMAADYLQVFHFAHGLLLSNKIQWRTRTIKIDGDKVVSE